MKIHGIEFGNVFNSSGARGFTGEGYWFHKYMKPFGLNYKNSTFVSKTTTLDSRVGNMPLHGISPKEKFPSCIIVKPFSGVVLNSVGLSGPGAKEVFRLLSNSIDNRSITKPFMISFMAVSETSASRFTEILEFVNILKSSEILGKIPIALQVNYSCPNVNLDLYNFSQEIEVSLRLLKEIGIPLFPKINVLFPINLVEMFQCDQNCYGIVVSNTIPWGKLPDQINWPELFGTENSPLSHIGGGGLSGKPLLPIVENWIRKVRNKGFTKSIIGGGGILSCDDADKIVNAGADAIELGSVSILRPWRVQKIIEYINSKLT